MESWGAVKRTYLDTSVLIEAFQGKNDAAVRALEVLDDPERQFVVSDFLRLEVLPKPTFLHRTEEVQFMRTFFEHAEEDVPSSKEVTGYALDLAAKYDMGAMDALHVGTALMADVDELVTLEKETNPMCCVREVKVISLHS